MKYIPYVFVLFAAILWGTTGTIRAYIEAPVAPISVAAFRSLFGGGILLLALLLMKKLSLRTWSWKWTILAALFIGLFQTAFFSSIQLAGVAIGTVLTIGSAPIFAGVIEWLLFKHKPSRTWGIATAFAIIGVCLLFLKTESGTIHYGGILYALCAGVFFAFYTNFSKKLMEREDALPAVAMTFTICAFLLMPFALQDGVTWLKEPNSFIPIIAMALFATTLAYILFLIGLQKIPSSSAVTLSLAEPLTAALLGVLLLKEQLAFVSWVGIACILGGIFVLTFSVKKTTD